MTDILFITDHPHGDGGAELNDRCLVKELRKKNNVVEFIKSERVNNGFLERNKDCKFIVSNFIYLHEFTREYMAKYMDYIIYEHDHKYCRSRDPGEYENCEVPESELINQEFYKNSRAIFCQSKLHKEIVQKNLSFLDDSQVVSVSGNFWEDRRLDEMERVRKEVNKLDKCAVMRSSIQHKATRKARNYCEQQEIDYNLISDGDYDSFLNKLGSHKYFAFFPETVETLSRVIVEAKMMGVAIITYANAEDRIGALSEDWMRRDSGEVVEHMKETKERVTEIILEKLCEK